MNTINILLSKCNKGNNCKVAVIVLKTNEDDYINDGLFKILVKNTLIIDFNSHAETMETNIRSFFDSVEK